MAIGPTEFYSESGRKVALDRKVKEYVDIIDEKLSNSIIVDNDKSNFVSICVDGLISKELRELISREYIKVGWSRVCSHLLDFCNSKSTKFVFCKTKDKDYAKHKDNMNSYIVIE